MSRVDGGVTWLSRRAVALHAALLLALPLCGIAAWWQVNRALSGNILSWMYVFEWPAFAGIGIWLWWVLLTTKNTPVDALEGEPADRLISARSRPLQWDSEAESAELTTYNSFLAELNAGRSAVRPQAPLTWTQFRLRISKVEARGS